MAYILVVEDDKLLGKGIVRALEGAKHTVFWATDSFGVWETLGKETIDLIFLDIMLPGENGYEILKKLKALDSQYKQISVIMLTNLGQIEEMERALALGASDYVIKANIDLDKIVALAHERVI